jgi:hypothetical protein
MITKRTPLLVAAAVAATLAVAACGSSKSSSSTTTAAPATTTTIAPAGSTGTTVAGQQDVCQARDNLQKSLSSLPAAVTGGAAGLQSAADQLKTQVDALVSAAQTDYKPQADALQSSWQAFSTAVGNLSSSGVSGIAAVASALSDLQKSATALFNEIQASCP